MGASVGFSVARKTSSSCDITTLIGPPCSARPPAASSMVTLSATSSAMNSTRHVLRRMVARSSTPKNESPSVATSSDPTTSIAVSDADVATSSLKAPWVPRFIVTGRAGTALIRTSHRGVRSRRTIDSHGRPNISRGDVELHVLVHQPGDVDDAERIPQGGEGFLGAWDVGPSTPAESSGGARRQTRRGMPASHPRPRIRSWWWAEDRGRVPTSRRCIRHPRVAAHRGRTTTLPTLVSNCPTSLRSHRASADRSEQRALLR